MLPAKPTNIDIGNAVESIFDAVSNSIPPVKCVSSCEEYHPIINLICFCFCCCCCCCCCCCWSIINPTILRLSWVSNHTLSAEQTNCYSQQFHMRSPIRYLPLNASHMVLEHHPTILSIQQHTASQTKHYCQPPFFFTVSNWIPSVECVSSCRVSSDPIWYTFSVGVSVSSIPQYWIYKNDSIPACVIIYVEMYVIIYCFPPIIIPMK